MNYKCEQIRMKTFNQNCIIQSALTQFNSLSWSDGWESFCGRIQCWAKSELEIQTAMQQKQDVQHPSFLNVQHQSLSRYHYLIRIHKIVSLSQWIPNVSRLEWKRLHRTVSFSPHWHNSIRSVDRTDQRAFADGFNVELNQNSKFRPLCNRIRMFSIHPFWMFSINPCLGIISDQYTRISNLVPKNSKCEQIRVKNA
jgi:hypothetical protein